MDIVKLSATESTNAYLKDYLLSLEEVNDYTVVVANEQIKGRGQMGTVWVSDPGKNLTFSISKSFDDFYAANQFVISMCVSLAIYDFLKQLQVPNLTIKWPNDILSGNLKIAGILIENILLGSKIQVSVIGIGLNVNQMVFEGLPNVSSLKLLFGCTFNLDDLLTSFIRVFKNYFDKEIQNSKIELQSLYENVLFRKNKPSTFKNMDGELFMGFIKGVTQQGKLLITLEDNIVAEFDLKEVQLLY